MRYIDLAGQKFGRLTVIGIAEKATHGKTVKWLCKCECGKEVIVNSSALRHDHTKSCGCLQSEVTIARNYKHGLAHRHKLYSVWNSMRCRCNNIGDNSFSRYGGRGISICPEWNNSFIAFYQWAIANGYKEGLSIDRINNDGNYEPSNCRWATVKEQASNRRRSA